MTFTICGLADPTASLSFSRCGMLCTSNGHGAKCRICPTCCGGEDCSAAQRQSASALQAPLKGAQEAAACGRHVCMSVLQAALKGLHIFCIHIMQQVCQYSKSEASCFASTRDSPAHGREQRTGGDAREALAGHRSRTALLQRPCSQLSCIGADRAGVQGLHWAVLHAQRAETVVHVESGSTGEKTDLWHPLHVVLSLSTCYGRASCVSTRSGAAHSMQMCVAHVHARG